MVTCVVAGYEILSPVHILYAVTLSQSLRSVCNPPHHKPRGRETYVVSCRSISNLLNTAENAVYNSQYARLE